jgi:hypothetical protein
MGLLCHKIFRYLLQNIIIIIYIYIFVQFGGVATRDGKLLISCIASLGGA